MDIHVARDIWKGEDIINNMRVDTNVHFGIKDPLPKRERV